jgi:pSer/pThr/pTyr-binding forkhead associated (FHA) protein
MGKKLALVIGNSEYDDKSLARLATPSEDVNDLAAALRSPDIGSFDEVTSLVNQPASTLRRSIAQLFAQKSPDDLLLLYFSGHGVLDDQGQLYLAVKDTERDLLSGTAIPAGFITLEMDRSRSRRQVLILDCCHSGAFARGTKGAVGGSVGTASAFEGTGYGRVVLTATDATQYAWEGDQVIGQAENSVFTHFVIQGLQTGEADVNGDGNVTLDELYDYVYAQVIARTPKQTPGKWSYKQQGEFVIARNPHPIVKPIELPAELRAAIESPLASVREGVARELERLLNGSNAGLALSAFEALKQLVDDDSRRVSSAASTVLGAYAEKQHALEAQTRLVREQAEAKRLAEEAQRAEQERLAKEKAEQEQLAHERAEQWRLAEEKRLAEQRAKEERLAREKLAEEKETTQPPGPPAMRAAADIVETPERLAAPVARLSVRQGSNAGQTFTLKAGENVIGRVSGLDMTIPDTLISRRHAVITVERDRVTIKDLDSANGTFVNHQRISGRPVVLHDGDQIGVGDAVLVFQSPALATATQPQPFEPVKIEPAPRLEGSFLSSPRDSTMMAKEPARTPPPASQVAPSAFNRLVAPWLMFVVGWGVTWLSGFVFINLAGVDLSIRTALMGSTGAILTGQALKRTVPGFNSRQVWLVTIGLVMLWAIVGPLLEGL